MVARIKATVLVAQHEPVTRLGLIHLINSGEQLEVCGEAETSQGTRDFCELYKPRVALIDPDLEGGGTALLRDLARWVPETKVVVFTATSNALAVQRALAAGALGYVTRHDQAADILTTLCHALLGQRHLSPKVEHTLLESLAHGGIQMPAHAESLLSDRELQVYRLIGLGKALREVASDLHLSVKTVETHRHRIKLKLHVTSGAELQRRAILYCDGIVR